MTIGNLPPVDTSLTALRQIGLHLPQALATLIQVTPRTSTPDQTSLGLPDQVWRTLLAELQLRLDQPRIALATIRDAAALTGRDPAAVLCLAAVSADLHLIAADSETPDICRMYLRLAERCGNPTASVHADALLAVATFHHLDAARGHARLTSILRQRHEHYGDDAITLMLHTGLTAMTDTLTDQTHHRPLPTDLWIPAPGGHPHPDLTHPPEHYLTSRIHLHPPAHPVSQRTHSRPGPRPPPPKRRSTPPAESERTAHPASPVPRLHIPST